MNKRGIEKAIEVLRGIYPSQKAIKTGEYDHVADALDDAISSLEHQLTNGWISVSERLPECNGRYITTSKLDNYTETEVYDLWLENGIWYTDEEDEEYEGDVIAWRNLPEQYKEVSE